MTLRRRLLVDLLVGVVVTVMAMGVVYWQAATADPHSSSGHAFRLVCPLH
jgi:CHASE3 domain sensor protein